MISPKGKFRMWQLALLTVLIALLAAVIDPVMLKGWGGQAVVQFAKAACALMFAYWVNRWSIHTRTHELSGEQKETRNNVIIIANALIIGAVLLSG